LRGYPVIGNYSRVEIIDGNNIIIKYSHKRDVIISFYPDISSPDEFALKNDDSFIIFRSMHKRDGIYFSKSINVRTKSQRGGNLQISIKKLTFNGSIPQEVFQIIVPDDFLIKTFNG
jgi:hypothetical protein